MKVGILSKHRVVNYGSFLQAYALKNMIQRMGHKVRFIDLLPAEGKQVDYLYDEPRWKRIARNIIYKKDLKQYNQFYEARQELFIDKLFRTLGLSEKPTYKSEYDAVVIGSDEMFNCTEEGTFWGESMQMFGQGINSDNIFSYAASFGYTTIERLENRKLERAVSDMLKNNFNSISVRDENSEKIVTKLTGIQPQVHLDPVLIYDFSYKVPKKVNMANYIAVYGYDRRMQETEYINQLKEFAHKKGKKLVGIGLWQDWCDENILVSPFEVLAYIRDADYVFCETFHGAIFSIKYNKNFACYVRASNHNKLYGLLSKFELTDRIVAINRSIVNIFDEQPDYATINKKIDEERKKTMEYLENNLR